MRLLQANLLIILLVSVAIAAVVAPFGGCAAQQAKELRNESVIGTKTEKGGNEAETSAATETDQQAGRDAISIGITPTLVAQGASGTVIVLICGLVVVIWLRRKDQSALAAVIRGVEINASPTAKTVIRNQAVAGGIEQYLHAAVRRITAR